MDWEFKRLKNSFLCAFVIFAGLYVPLDFFHFEMSGKSSALAMIMASGGLGILVCLPFLFSKKICLSYWLTLICFWGLFLFVFIASTFLFFLSPKTGLLHTVFYCFPQTVILLYSLVGDCVFWIVFYLGRKKQLQKS